MSSSEEECLGFSDASLLESTVQAVTSIKEKMELLKRERSRIVQSLARIDTFVAQFVESDFQEAKPRLELLNQRWKEFQESALKISEVEDNEANELLYETIEAQVMRLKGALSGILSAKEEKPRVKRDRDNDECNGFRLPRLSLPEFSGKYDEWLSYHDMFLVTVHENERLSPVEKMLYLKGSLKGEALKVVDALQACNANYSVAWEALKKRYSNEYILKKRHVNAMLQWPRMKTMSATSIHGLIDCFERNLKILKQLGESTEQWGCLIIQIIISKLDEETQQKWEKHVEDTEENAVTDLLNFLCTQTRIMDAFAVDKPMAAGKFTGERRVATNVAAEVKCFHCDGSHMVENCDAFRRLAVARRREVVNVKKLCVNCLKQGHFQAKCWSRARCHFCNQKHHSLMHNESVSETANTSSYEEMPCTSGTQNAVVNASSDTGCTSILLSTAIVNMCASGSKWLPARALIDSGSQVNLMTKGLAARLKLPLHDSGTVLTGVGHSMVDVSKSVTTFLRSRSCNYEERMEFLVLPKISSYRPVAGRRLCRENLPKGFVLADPDFDSDAEVDLLLGSEFYANFLKPDRNGNVKCEIPSLPTFISTVFGWVAIGKMSVDMDESDQYVTCGTCTRLDDLIERFWLIEEVREVVQSTQEEKDCEEHFVQHHQRDDKGRYIVKLPFKCDMRSQLGHSEETARKRFLQLERRFDRDRWLKQEYTAVIKEYIDKGFLKKAVLNPVTEAAHEHFYLPHHAVIKASSSSTKVRPVFDGSARTDGGKSLNDLLMTGPVIQENLLALLLKFRTRHVALVADIKQMYLQVKVHHDHTRFQRILWRDSSEQPIEVFELQRVTFGIASSSFLAIRTLQQLAHDEGEHFPLAKRALLDDFYVDDYIGGASNEEEATRLQAEMTSLLKLGGFHITKWNSNRKDVLCNVPDEDKATAKVKMFEVPEEPVKTLGIAWLPDTDQLYIDSNIQMTNETWSRRKIYSLVARIYDPLGLVAPVTAWAKINMQVLWVATSDWDEPIPAAMQDKWCAFQSQLSLLKEAKFSRQAVVENCVSMQLHCFSDASEAAYGACVYMRSVDKNGRVVSELLTAKSRPAPLKKISLARLELCGALLAARLLKAVRQSLKLLKVETYVWTDATIVLHWIRAPSYSWATYVANRVSEIQDLTRGCKWMHVRGVDNPADIVSRGAMPSELLASKLWFHGPSWLKQCDEEWQVSDATSQPDEELLERRKNVVVAAVNTETDSWCDSFSSYERMLRVTAYCMRFIRRCQQKSKYGGRCLSLSELAEAKMLLVKMEQRKYFASELKELSSGHCVRPKSSLKTLGPFLDSDGCLRVGGRLNRAKAAHGNSKYPLALPKRSRFARLVAEYYHRMALHGGPTATLSALRREFWPVQGRSLVNNVCRSCLVCFRMNPVLVQQPPGQLPVARATPARPFSIVGIDFCGPIYLKPVHRRAAAEKAYIAIFVCFSVKAVHIELVESLSTPAFLAAFRRFAARRGLPSEVYSDNGLNFQGARKVIDDFYALLKSDQAVEEISSYAASNGIQWHFIPPHAPNFGGLWEAAVKAAKRVLLKVIGNRQLTYGEMSTVLAQVEAQLNSRPLTPLSEDPEELDVLTPGHFLIGAPLNALPGPDVSEIPTNRLKRYEELQQVIQNCWVRWRREYFSELHNEHQRAKAIVELKVGQMVLLKEDGKTPQHWPLGRIMEVYPGPDGVVRVVNVKTGNGVYKRPANRLCLLPFERGYGNSENM